MKLVKVLQGSSSNWKKEVLKSEIPVVVEFYTPTCPYCKMLTPIFEKLSDDYSEKILFVKVDASIERDLASGYGVMGVPALKFLCAGRPIGELVGLKSEEELKETFEKILKDYQKCISQSSPLYT
jgi:thioredoxin